MCRNQYSLQCLRLLLYQHRRLTFRQSRLHKYSLSNQLWQFLLFKRLLRRLRNQLLRDLKDLHHLTNRGSPVHPHQQQGHHRLLQDNHPVVHLVLLKMHLQAVPLAALLEVHQVVLKVHPANIQAALHIQAIQDLTVPHRDHQVSNILLERIRQVRVHLLVSSTPPGLRRLARDLQDRTSITPGNIHLHLLATRIHPMPNRTDPLAANTRHIHLIHKATPNLLKVILRILVKDTLLKDIKVMVGRLEAILSHNKATRRIMRKGEHPTQEDHIPQQEVLDPTKVKDLREVLHRGQEDHLLVLQRVILNMRLERRNRHRR